jgi:hypothetical protein
MNVYYLPSRQDTSATPELSLTASRWSVYRARTHRAWWRLRLTLTEIMSVIRRGGPRNPLDGHIWFAAEDTPAPVRRRSAGPARVLDFEAARRRRSLAAASV